MSTQVGSSVMDTCVNRRITQEQRKRLLQSPKKKAAVRMNLR